MLTSLLKSNPFVKQVSILAGGTALAQIVNLAILPILTRLYSPEVFGLFAVMTASAALGGVFVTFCYENAIIATDSMTDSKTGVYSVFGISLVMSIFGIIALSGTELFIGLSDTYYKIGMLAILYALMSAWVQALYFYCNRRSDYRKMTKGRVYGAISLAVISISWGVILDSFWGLLLGSFSGVLVNLLYLFLVNKDITLREFVSQSSAIKSFVIRHRRFPKYLVLSTLLDRTGSQGYLLFFTKVFGEAVSGALSLYNKVAGLPSVLVGSAIGDVFKRNASEQLRANGECRRLLKKTAITLSLIAFVPFLILLLLGPLLFTLVFGPQWGIAGEFAQILAPVFLLGFVVSPISTLIYLEENQKFDLFLQIILISLLTITLLLAISYSDVYMAVAAYALSYVIKYLIEAAICWNIANGKY